MNDVMETRLPSEIADFRAKAREFAAEALAPHAGLWDQQAALPDDLVSQLADAGFLGSMVPARYGGGDVGLLGTVVVLEELARHDGSTALVVNVHNGFAVGHLVLEGSDEQKREYLPALALGKTLGAWALTEPEAGSDAAALATTAVRDGDDYVLNGEKSFVTNGLRAGLYVIFAKTDPTAGAKGISAFLVERNAPGLQVGPKDDKLGMRAADTVTLTLKNVRVPAANVLGSPGRGLSAAGGVLARARVGVAAVALGLARGALEQALDYAGKRVQFGKPIIEQQAVGFMLADMATDVEAARLMIHQAAAGFDAGRDDRLAADSVKLFASEMATRTALKAVQILGAAGYTRAHPVERYLRDAKHCELGGGTSEMLRISLVRRLLQNPQLAEDI